MTMTTTIPTRDELRNALMAHSRAELAWKDLMNRMDDHDTWTPGESVTLNHACSEAWQRLLDLSDRLPTDAVQGRV